MAAAVVLTLGCAIVMGIAETLRPKEARTVVNGLRIADAVVEAPGLTDADRARPGAHPNRARTTGSSPPPAASAWTSLRGRSSRCWGRPSGKSSLLRAVAGLEPLVGGPWRGTARTSPTCPRTANFGLMFQEPALFPNLSVGRNVAYGLHALPRRSRGAVVEEFLDLVGLAWATRRDRSTSCPAGKRSGWRWRGRSHPGPGSCCWMSRSRRWDRTLREHLVGPG